MANTLPSNTLSREEFLDALMSIDPAEGYSIAPPTLAVAYPRPAGRLTNVIAPSPGVTPFIPLFFPFFF